MIGAFIGLLAGCFETVNAQLNEKRIQRQATGVYTGQVSGITRTRLVPDHDPETILYDDAQGKMKVPVREKKVKSTVVDDQIEGDGAAQIAAKGKSVKVKKGGKKLKYAANRGSFDAVNDGHNPVTNGTANGTMVQRGKKWNASAQVKGQRLDNDGYTSLFSATPAGQH